MRVHVRFAGLAILVLVSAGCECGAQPASSAPTGSLSATGQPLELPTSVTLAPEAVAPLAGAPDGSRSGRYPSPIPTSLLIRVPAARGPIVATSLQGEAAWEADVGPLYPGAFVLDGALIVRGRTTESGVVQATLTALELSTGVVRWRHRDGDTLLFGAPTGAGSEVYAMRIGETACAGVAVVDVRTGEANDRIETPCLRFVSTGPLEIWEPSLRPDGEGAIVLGRSEGEGHALVSLGIDGEVRWRVEAALGTQPPLAPVVLSGAVLALDRGVRALDRDSGEEFWSAPMTARELAVGGGRVFVTVGDTVRSLDATDGAPRFAASLPGVARSPRVHGDLLLVETDGALHALSADDGSVRWVHASAARVSGVAISDDAVFVSTTREVLRIGRQDGDVTVLAGGGGQHLIVALAER